MDKTILWAWAAGLFEGEGSVNRRRYGYSITVSMTDRDVLLRFYTALECGRLYGPYQPKNLRAKKVWKWVVSDKAGILQFQERVGALLCSRRKVQLRPVFAHVARMDVKWRGRSSCWA